MYRLGVVALTFGIIAAAFGAAWLAGCTRFKWAPAAAFWVTAFGLTALSYALGVDLSTYD